MSDTRGCWESEDPGSPERGSIALYIRTSRYLEARQIVARLSKMLKYRLIYKRIPRMTAFVIRRRGDEWLADARLRSACRHLCQYVARGDGRDTAISVLPGGRQAVFRFLNTSRKLDVDATPWTHKDWDRLWLYHLNYFEYLPELAVLYQKRGDPDLIRAARGLVENWIASNPPGTECSWDPYPMSLRIRNWIWAYRLLDPGSREARVWERVAESIHQQASLLARNLEFDLGANHLLENCLGLLVAGHCFGGSRAEKWRTKALGLLRRELDRQLLADGGHYERSPMYHSILLGHMLETAALLPRDAEESALLRKASSMMLQFLSAIVCRDGEIPLFGDSVFGAAPRPASLFRYADAVLGSGRSSVAADPSSAVAGCRVLALEGTGFYKLLSPTSEITFNGDGILSQSQPGHAHCDLFSYELLLNRDRVVVDTGVFTYYGDFGARAYCRGTRAHNTTMLDGEEQLEIWGRFRVGRRPRVLLARAYTSDGMPSFDGCYVGFRRALTAPRIHRWARLLPGDVLLVLDRVRVSGHHVAESFIHFHPGIELEGAPLVFRGSCGAVRVVPLDGVTEEITAGCYFPEFGKEQRNLTVRLHREGDNSLLIGYLVGPTLDDDSCLRESSHRLDRVVLSIRTTSWEGDVSLLVC